MNEYIYLNCDYSTLAQKLSRIIGLTIAPSRLESFAFSHGTHENHVEIIPDRLTGCSFRYKSPNGLRDYAEFLLRTQSEELLAQDVIHSTRGGLRIVSKRALEKLVYLAENLEAGRRTEHGRQLLVID